MVELELDLNEENIELKLEKLEQELDDPTDSDRILKLLEDYLKY